jgi:hypothetical protein
MDPEKQVETDERELRPEEVAEEAAVDLPDREAMSVLRLDIEGVDNFAMPINEAFALNNYSNSSIAMADADQVVIIDQDATADTE